MIEAADNTAKGASTINEIRVFQDGSRTINQLTPMDFGVVAFVGAGQIVGTKRDGSREVLAQFNFGIEAATIQEAFAKFDEAQKEAAAKVIEEMKKPKIQVPGIGNGPAYRPPRRF